MPIGLNRENDTPIGGAQEFRGNLQAPMSVWGTDDVPAQSASFALQVQANATGTVGVTALAPASQTFDIISASLNARRIG